VYEVREIRSTADGDRRQRVAKLPSLWSEEIIPYGHLENCK
jgi:hypothetical protein